MRLHYRQYSGQGEPLLILHGLFGNLGNWNWHSQRLAQKFSVYALDLRNHGDSPHSPELDYPVMAADVKALLDDLQIPACHLIGHSMGGKVAMQMALNWPAAVSKLIVVDIAPVTYTGSAEEHHRLIAGMKSLAADGVASRAEAERRLAQYVEDKATRSFALTNLVRDAAGRYRWRLNVEAIERNYDRLRDKPSADQPFDKPALFVKGALSGYVRERHRPEIMQLFPGATLRVVEDAGHWLHVDQPAAFQQMVLEFLA